MTSSIAKLKHVAEVFKKLNSDFTVQQIGMLLEVAVCENGITMPELVEATGMSQGGVSRNVKMMSSYIEQFPGHKPVVQGFKILETKQDLNNRRCLSVSLSEKGKGIMERVTAILLEKE